MKYQVDFDGVIAYHEHDWPAEKIGRLLRAGEMLLVSLINAGHDVSILTARPVEQHLAMGEWIKDRLGIELRVTNIKEPADAYIDDKAISWVRNLD